jgi:putative membrane protein
MICRAIGSAIAAALFGAALALAASTVNSEGQKFIQAAIEGNLAEIELGKLAQGISKDERIRAFGEVLVKDHLAVNEKALALANKAGVNPPAEPDNEQKATYDKLSKLSGDAFDREFLRRMADDHQKAFKDYEAAAHNPSRDVDDFARATIATLKKHLDTAQSLAKSKAASR